MKKKRMKTQMKTSKVWKTFEVLVICLLLAGCVRTTVAPQSTATVALPAPTETMAPPTETAVPASAAASAVELNCEDQAVLDDGSFRVENNTWGKGDLTGWSQCIGLKANADGTAAARWKWDWPASGSNVKAYPEVIYGQKPGGTSTTPDLPRQVNGLNELVVSYDYTTTTSGSGNLAFDVWLTDTDNPDTFGVPPITTELMIWVDNFGSLGPGGNWEEVIKIDGVPYSLYTAKNWGDGWDYVAFVMTEPQTGDINVVSFLKYMKEKGLITGEEYVASVEFGNEVVGGKGETFLNMFSVSVR